MGSAKQSVMRTTEGVQAVGLTLALLFLSDIFYGRSMTMFSCQDWPQPIM